MHDVYLKDLVAAKLAERGQPGSVHIRPNKPLAARLELGERATLMTAKLHRDMQRRTLGGVP